MRVLLIHPRGSNWIAGRRDVTTAANVMAPLGLASIAAVLEQRGIEVGLQDMFARRRPAAAWLAEAAAFDPDWIGLSCTTSSFLDGVDLARELRAHLPRARIVAGGVHLSAAPQASLERFPELDFGVAGEGEETMAELVSGRPPESIAGLAWRDGARVVANPRRPAIADLDRLPRPAYHLLDGYPKRYRLPLLNYPSAPGATVNSSRGCPYQCSYCDRSVFGPSFRAHSAEALLDHLGFLVDRYGVRHVNFYDDLFTYDRDRVAAFCEGLLRLKRRPTFNCAVQSRHMPPDLLALLARAGCWMVSVGIETGDPELLRRHKAGGDLDELRRAVAAARRAGLRVKGLFMMGLPGESPASFERTIETIAALELDDVNLARFTPFPGAPLWASIREHGKFEEHWRRMNCMNFVFVPHGYRDVAQMEALYNRCIRAFYRSPRVRRGIARQILRHPHHLGRLIGSLPAFLAARAEFSR